MMLSIQQQQQRSVISILQVYDRFGQSLGKKNGSYQGKVPGSRKFRRGASTLFKYYIYLNQTFPDYVFQR